MRRSELQQESLDKERKMETDSQQCDTSGSLDSMPQEPQDSLQVSRGKGRTKKKTVRKLRKGSEQVDTLIPEGLEVVENSLRILALPDEEALVRMAVQSEPAAVGQMATQISRFLGHRDPMKWMGVTNLSEFKMALLKVMITGENELSGPVRAMVWNAVRSSGATYDKYVAVRVAFRAAFLEFVRDRAMEEFAG
jgi:hypothetical protein